MKVKVTFLNLLLEFSISLWQSQWHTFYVLFCHLSFNYFFYMHMYFERQG